MDKRKNNKGTQGNKGGGRKTKADELRLIEKLDNIINQDEVINTLKDLIKDGNFNAIKLYMEYRFGKPKEVIENINRNFEAGKLSDEEVKMLNKALETEY